MATINQVAKKWANRTMKKLKEDGQTYNPNEAGLMEHYTNEYWNPFIPEVKEATDYRKMFNAGENPKDLAIELLEKYAERSI
jgi:hypothetical protein